MPVRRPMVVSSRIGVPAMNRPPMRPLVRRYSVTWSHKTAFATSRMPSSLVSQPGGASLTPDPRQANARSCEMQATPPG